MSGDRTPHRTRTRIISGILVVGLVYIASLAGYSWVRSATADLSSHFDATPAEQPVVSIYMGALDTETDELRINVLLIPPERYIDKRLNVLNTDIVIRLYPWADVGDLKYPKGQRPATISATIEAYGDAHYWPFDTYRTKAVTADALVGSGDSQIVEPASIRLSGEIAGWNVDIEETDSDPRASVVSLQRHPGTLAFDLGICLVLISLPVMAMIVAVRTVRGRRQFLPPLMTWFAAMLFAVVPLRNILPGAPPPGAWVDQAIVLWVLIALVSAMVLYTVAWYRDDK